MTKEEAFKPANAHMSMSAEARARLRQAERPVFRYYNDMGKNKGNCTWGVGIKAHDGPCNAEELKREVSAAQIESAFALKVAEAERGVRRRVLRYPLTQRQFDALVSLAYNTGVGGAADVFDLIDEGKLKQAGTLIAAMVKARVKEKDGTVKYVVLKGLVVRRAEESRPFLDAAR